MWLRWSLFSLFAVSLIQLIKADGCEDTKPDFRAPGRRISEQKCREFNWVRKRLEKCSTDAAHIKYPYMGALGYRKENDQSLSFLCGSFLVSEKFSLTAAHCIKVPPHSGLSKPEIVRFGNENIKDEVPRLDAKIRSTTIHPEYKPPKKYYDIALVELESPVQFTKSIYPACIWSQAGFGGVEYADNPAWGLDSFKGVQRSVIAVMKVKVLDHNTCIDNVKSWYNRNFQQLQDHQICVNESVSPILNCQGSAGAPAVTTISLDGNSADEMPYAFGVTSFGRRCGDLGVVTSISSFIDWIEQKVWPVESGSAPPVL